MNNINRHNYETFFLLYADNELPDAERKAVDEFVQLNSDLQEELVMLQQSVLKPDHIVFDDKDSLFKNELIPADVQQKLLSYLDDELTAAEKNAVDELIETDASIEKEWGILRQTKLLTDNSIVLEDKLFLYRKASGRLVAFPWLRVAVAAVFIGVCVWGGMNYFNNNNKLSDGEIGKNTITKTISKKVKQVVPQIPVTAGSTVKKQEKNATNQMVTIKSTEAATLQNSKEIVSRKLIGGDIQTIAEKEKNYNLPKPYLENVNNIGSNKTIIAFVTPEKQSNAYVNTGGNENTNNTGKPNPDNVYASSTSFTESSEGNNNRIFFMDEEKIKKTKLGGIFRKVKRVIERNTNIKSGGNNIKVANLEFAIQ